MILVICSIYSFLSNSSITGPSVYIGIYSKEFSITPTKASGLVSYSNLAYGFSKEKHSPIIGCSQLMKAA